MNTNFHKTLFLLTKTYPFGNGEQYITNELQYLSQKFEKIIIYPNDYYSENITHNKIIPSNVTILNLNQSLQNDNTTLSDYIYLIKQTILELINTDDKKYFFKNFKWNMINFWSQLVLSKTFVNYLNKNNFNKNNTVFYSYWFHKSAILLSILKDRNYITNFISRAHSIDLYHNKWGIISNTIKVPPYKLFKLKHTNHILPVSEHGTTFLKNEFQQYSQKITTKYLGVIDEYKKTEKSNNSVFHIVTCSGIDNNKRVHFLAHALDKINHSVKWTHFGTGVLLPQVESIIKNYRKNITVDLKGNVSNLEVKKFYAENHINLFVNLSIVEGLPVSIMEAMMFEIPILATDVYGTPEAVIDNKNGFLIDVDFTEEELISKLNYCITHPEELKSMGTKSREIYLAKFDANKNYSNFANYLASL